MQYWFCWQVEYELNGYGVAPDYFAIDKDSGVITIKADLQPELESDFEVEHLFLFIVFGQYLGLKQII